MASSLTSTLHRLALALGVVAGLGLVAPEIASAERPSTGLCKRKKSNKRKKRARRRRAAKKATFNARTVKRLQKRGLTDAQIVAKAKKANYVMNKKQERRMKRMRVRRSLIAALAAPATDAPVASAPIPAAKPIDLNNTIDPNDIDFDSVPPPDGMPTVARKKAEPEKKGLDTSLRPSAPFVAKKAAPAEKKAPRKVLTAAN